MDAGLRRSGMTWPSREAQTRIAARPEAATASRRASRSASRVSTRRFLEFKDATDEVDALFL